MKHFNHDDKMDSNPGTSPAVWQRLRPADIFLSSGRNQEKLHPRNVKAQISSAINLEWAAIRVVKWL